MWRLNIEQMQHKQIRVHTIQRFGTENTEYKAEQPEKAKQYSCRVMQYIELTVE